MGYRCAHTPFIGQLQSCQNFPADAGVSLFSFVRHAATVDVLFQEGHNHEGLTQIGMIWQVSLLHDPERIPLGSPPRGHAMMKSAKILSVRIKPS